MHIDLIMFWIATFKQIGIFFHRLGFIEFKGCCFYIILLTCWIKGYIGSCIEIDEGEMNIVFYFFFLLYLPVTQGASSSQYLSVRFWNISSTRLLFGHSVNSLLMDELIDNLLFYCDNFDWKSLFTYNKLYSLSIEMLYSF